MRVFYSKDKYSSRVKINGVRQMNKPLLDAEWIIMEAIWDKQPQTLGQIIEAIRQGRPDIEWDYKTYHTHLRRMTQRGLIASDAKNLRDKLYYALVTRDNALDAEGQELLRRSARFGSVGRLVKTLGQNGQLSDEDKQELLSLARELEQKEKSED